MMSKQAVAAMILSLVIGAASFPRAASGQLPSASTTPLATANNYTALARGFTAISLNPAALGMPGNPGFSFALLPVEAREGLNAFSINEIASFGGIALPDSTREAWLQSVVDEGGFKARAGAAATLFAFSAGRFGLQVSTVGVANATLAPDAFELALFGNAGLTGTPRDMTLDSTEVDGFWASTAALAFGLPLPDAMGGNFAVGATLKYTVGHVILTGGDDGSVITANPVRMDLALPSIAPDSLTANAGTGMGLDLSLAWQDSTWAVSFVVQNVFNTFQWDLDAFAYRPGEVIVDGTTTSDDFQAVPVTAAPQALQDEVLAQRFDPAITLGLAYRTSDKLALTADLRYDSGDALVLGYGSQIGLGVEFLAIPILSLRGGFAVVSGGAFQLAGGVGLKLGPVNLSAAYLSEPGSSGEFRAAQFALTFGHN